MEIVVLDGRDVPNPEDMAMLAALYSRCPKSVLLHLEDIRKRGSSSFADKYYVQYGHKSIGDCGSATMFVEDVSMLAAKAVQDTPLYNGQESSTRYIDFTVQPVLNPCGTDKGKEVQSRWLSLYTRAFAAVVERLKLEYPKKDDQKQTQWQTAINARAFDICRSLISAGWTTKVAWHSNLRQFNDHSKELRNHPLPEMRNIGTGGIDKLKEKCSSSFGHKLYPDQEAYIAKSMERFAYFDADIGAGTFYVSHNLDLYQLAEHRDLLETRPIQTELHQRFRQYGSITFKFGIDFGSYRDIQRQRSAVQEMPLLTMRHGFHPWYLAQLPDWVREEIMSISDDVRKLDCDSRTRQYYIPMGYVVPCVITCTLPSAVYIAELRSGETVHPTLRVLAQKMGTTLKQIIPYLVLHLDMSEDKWSFKRGAQDIVKKEAV